MRQTKITKASSVPLYRQVAAQISREMAAGKIRTEVPLPSINQLTAELGVARNTVIQAMRQLIHDGYVVAKHGKGFFAVDPRLKPALSLIVPLHHYYYIQVYVNLIAGAQDAAAHRDEKVLIYNSQEEHTGFLSALHEVTSYRPQARLLVVPPVDGSGAVSARTAKELERVAATGVRMVVVDRELASPGIPQIVQDRLAGRKLLLQKLFESDCRRALFFGAATDEAALRRHAAVHQWRGHLSFAGPGRSNVEDLARIRKSKYDAVFCSNDLQARRIAIAAGDALDFRIAGYDGTVTATAVSPRITTVNANLTEAGELAFKHISTGSVSAEKITVQPFLVPGETF